MRGKYRGKIDCTADELAEILEEYTITCPIDKNGWVYGNLIDGDKPYIVGQVIESIPYGGIVLDYWYPVKKETVGQFTGLKDINGKEIYDRDIVKWVHINCHEAPIRIGVVEIKPNIQFRVNVKGLNTTFNYGFFAYQETEKYLEIIGNIHDNPELSEVKE